MLKKTTQVFIFLIEGFIMCFGMALFGLFFGSIIALFCIHCCYISAFASGKTVNKETIDMLLLTAFMLTFGGFVSPYNRYFGKNTDAKEFTQCSMKSY